MKMNYNLFETYILGVKVYCILQYDMDVYVAQNYNVPLYVGI